MNQEELNKKVMGDLVEWALHNRINLVDAMVFPKHKVIMRYQKSSFHFDAANIIYIHKRLKIRISQEQMDKLNNHFSDEIKICFKKIILDSSNFK